MKTIVVATPHDRYDFIVHQLRERLGQYKILKASCQEEINTELLTKWHPEWIFFPHWRWVIPKSVHEKCRCVIFHMTDLPYGRGGSPLQNLIVRGHKQTKLSAIKCVAEIDAGSVYKKVPLSLEGTAEEILVRAAHLMTDVIIDIVENDLTPSTQTGEIVEFKRRRPEDGDISTLVGIKQVYNFIRMLDGDNYPPAFIQTTHLRFEFSEACLRKGFIQAKVRITRCNDE